MYYYYKAVNSKVRIIVIGFTMIYSSPTVGWTGQGGGGAVI